MSILPSAGESPDMTTLHATSASGVGGHYTVRFTQIAIHALAVPLNDGYEVVWSYLGRRLADTGLQRDIGWRWCVGA